MAQKGREYTRPSGGRSATPDPFLHSLNARVVLSVEYMLIIQGPLCVRALGEPVPEGPGRVTPHPILGWDCGRARGTRAAAGYAHRTQYGTPVPSIVPGPTCVRYVSHVSVWSNTANTMPRPRNSLLGSGECHVTPLYRTPIIRVSLYFKKTLYRILLVYNI